MTITPKPRYGKFYHLVHESRRMLIDLVPSLRHTSDDASLLELLPAARKKEWGDKLAFQSFGSKVISVLSLNQQSPLSVAEIVEGWMLRGGGTNCPLQLKKQVNAQYLLQHGDVCVH